MHVLHERPLFLEIKSFVLKARSTILGTLGILGIRKKKLSENI
jgi:hypothetical protein